MTGIDSVIAEVTGVTTVPSETVWIYGRALWCHAGRMEFRCEGMKPGQHVVIATGLVKRYRDGDSDAFLIGMPKHMAEVLEVGEFLLTPEMVERKMRNCREF